MAGSDFPHGRVAGKATAWLGTRHQHGSPGHGAVLPQMGRGGWATSASCGGAAECFPPQHFAKRLQKLGLPRGQRDGLPHSRYLLEATGDFESHEDFMLFLVVLGGFFVSGGDNLACFLFFPLPKTPNKLGNSHHGTFRVLLKNTEAEKCQG